MKAKSTYMCCAAVAALLVIGNAAHAANNPNESVTITASPTTGFSFNDSDFRSERVSYSQQDLIRDGSYGRLMTKISSVAGRLCDEVGATDNWNLDQRQTCINGAVHDAVLQIDNPSDQRMAYAGQNVLDGAPVED